MQLFLLYRIYVGHQLHTVRLDAARSVRGARLAPVLLHPGSNYWILPGAGHASRVVQGAHQNVANRLLAPSSLT